MDALSDEENIPDEECVAAPKGSIVIPRGLEGWN